MWAKRQWRSTDLTRLQRRVEPIQSQARNFSFKRNLASKRTFATNSWTPASDTCIRHRPEMTSQTWRKISTRCCGITIRCKISWPMKWFSWLATWRTTRDSLEKLLVTTRRWDHRVNAHRMCRVQCTFIIFVQCHPAVLKNLAAIHNVPVHGKLLHCKKSGTLKIYFDQFNLRMHVLYYM